MAGAVMAGAVRIGDMRGAQLLVVAVAGAGLAAVTWIAHAAGGEARGAELAGAVGIGALGGIALRHASFGFTGAWRRLQRERRGAGVRAQLLLLSLVVLATYPLIAMGVFGQGWVFPVGLSSAIGAFVFGVGMQLGGGCGSGTLFTAGGGSPRMALTLAGFVAGSLIWTGTNPEFQAGLQAVWSGLGFSGDSRIGAFSALRMLGAPGALALTLAIFAAIAFWTMRLERAAHGGLERPQSASTLLNGPWSRALGAVVLAAVVLLCFAMLNRPWGVTAAFPLWGAKIADGLGLGVAEWRAWDDGAIDRSVFADATSVMNFGVMLGALGATGLAGGFAPNFRLSARDVATAVIGGLMMGYGARLAYGCNIGGLIGGIASASLHGWWWLLFGALGSVVGVWLRRLLGIDPAAAPRPT